MQLAPDFRLPKHFLVEQLGRDLGVGEDFPLYDLRLQREHGVPRARGPLVRS